MVASFFDFSERERVWKLIVLSTESPEHQESANSNDSGESRNIFQKWTLDDGFVRYYCVENTIDCEGIAWGRAEYLCKIENLMDGQAFPLALVSEDPAIVGSMILPVPVWVPEKEFWENY